MPTGPRGTAPVNPRDYTGRLFAQQQRAQMEKLKAARDIDNEIKEAREQGYQEGYSAAFEYIRANFDIFEKEVDDEIGIEVGR